jgi:hypothetical protein
MNVFTPRNLRKGSRNSGGKDKEKQKTFRRCKLISNRFIHQKASQLQKQPLREEYLVYCGLCDRDALRRGKK